ncbi:hypothetical protein MSMTP_2289 [Methanosarcina sp. MTP4]|uniref:hypothetical protein n=1 Tax=Methanosarcina sp. MTP4 TaxID=1434100 RepID=UPI0006157582|nr:hypothetical protein [Methanosarcina sp. MTP4]AKB25758.1 hypothetical protein MSMTP_2289 [Methanosarcina sp. MTP4]
MATLASIKKELQAIKAAAGTRARESQPREWEIKGLAQYRNALFHQDILNRIRKEPVDLPFNPVDYGRDLAYFEYWNENVYHFPYTAADEAKINKELTERLLNLINADAAPTVTG